MPSRCLSSLRRFAALAVVVSIGWFAVATAPATAGEFEVRSCQASSTRNSSAWVPGVQSVYVPGPFHWCLPGTGLNPNEMDMRESLALHTRYGVPSEIAGAGRLGSTDLAAPPASVLTRIRFQRRLKVYDPQWVPKILAGTTEIDACRPPVASSTCIQDNQPDVVKDVALANASTLTMAIDCEDTSCLDSTPISPWAMAALYSSIVTVEENVAPSVSVPAAVGAVSGWLGDEGGKVRLTGADTLGLRRLELLHQGAVVGTVSGACVDWSVKPCAEPSAGAATSLAGDLDVSGLSVPSGELSLQVRAVDAAGNAATSAPATIAIDKAAPQVPEIDASRDAPLRTLTWSFPSDRAPLASLVARTCIGPGTDQLTCAERPLSPSASSAQLTVPDGLVATFTLLMTNVLGRQGTSSVIVPFRTAAPVTPTPTPAPQPSPAPALRATALRLSAKRVVGRRLKLSGNATPGAARGVTIKLSAPRRGQKRWTPTVRLTPTIKTGRFARTITLPVAIRTGARITVAASSTPASGWRAATLTRTIRR